MHKSAYNRNSSKLLVHNERLEYLGDAILGSVIAELLFKQYPDEDEGFLTKLRSKIVNRKNLNKLAVLIGLEDLVIYRNYSNNSEQILGNALEALIGAVYLDKGYKKCRKFIMRQLIAMHLDLEELIHEDRDFKSRIIEWGQKNRKEINFESYEKYADLNKVPFFGSSVKISDEVIGEGEGRSKKEAEQHAAEQALKFVSM